MAKVNFLNQPFILESYISQLNGNVHKKTRKRRQFIQGVRKSLIDEVKSKKKKKKFENEATKTVGYPGFFWANQYFNQVSISLKCHHGQCSGEKILSFWSRRNCLSGAFLVRFLHVISPIIFAIKLVAFVLAYIMSSEALVFKKQ